MNTILFCGAGNT